VVSGTNCIIDNLLYGAEQLQRRAVVAGQYAVLKGITGRDREADGSMVVVVINGHMAEGLLAGYPASGGYQNDDENA